jgi:hypothetical protein
MAKPVIIIAFPIDVEYSEMEKAVLPIQGRLIDYHVIAYRATNVKDLDFKVFNADNANDLDIVALKKEIKEKTFNK